MNEICGNRVNNNRFDVATVIPLNHIQPKPQAEINTHIPKQ
jgi:hypothetical protein